MRLFILTLALLIGATAQANEFGIHLNPGETLVAVDGIPVPVEYPDTSTNLVPMARGGDGYSTGGSDAFTMLNRQRSRRGIHPLAFDPVLQSVAERRVSYMAQTGMKSHPPGSFSPGRFEGVGWSSQSNCSEVSACYTEDPNMRACGAAMAHGRDGVYFAVVYR